MMGDMTIAILVILGWIIIDQITKIIAQNKLYKNKIKKSVHVWKDYFYFTYIENSGMAMGKYNGKYLYLYVATVLSLAVFSFCANYIDFHHNVWFSIGLCTLIGGTIGNFIDRVLRGYVIDFITGRIGKLNLPVYNIADLCIFIGGILTILFSIIRF